METYGNPVLEGVQFNDDGSLKESGRQNIRFYKKKFLEFRARPDLNEDGTQKLDQNGKPKFLIDPKTGIPFKDAIEVEREMIRVETKGDTNIKDDIANAVDKMQHKRYYRFFREGKMPTGHLIEDFEFIQPSVLMELHMMGVHSIEEVAAMDDLECEQLKDQPGYELRDIACQWVRMNSPQGINEKTLKLEKQVSELQRQLEDMTSKKGKNRIIPEILSSGAAPEVIKTMEVSHEEFKKGRGRKRLVE